MRINRAVGAGIVVFWLVGSCGGPTAPNHLASDDGESEDAKDDAKAVPPRAPVAAGKYRIKVLGAGEASYQMAPTGRPVQDPAAYEVAVVGGGLAGLSAAVFLSDFYDAQGLKDKKVILLEKSEQLGGLAAAGALDNGISFDRGSAYFTSAYEEELAILKRIGLKRYKEFEIHKPIDSYLWNGVFYEGVWEEKATMAKLPPSFEVMRAELKRLEKDIPNQPIEEDVGSGGAMAELDKLSAGEWLRSLPKLIKGRTDAKSKALVVRLEKYVAAELARGNREPSKDPMIELVRFLDLYCRSALGGLTGDVSALAFVNFYISEIEERYTSPIGTGVAAKNMMDILGKRTKQVTLQSRSTVTSLSDKGYEVQVTYVQGGGEKPVLKQLRAKYVVYAGQLKFAPKLIEGLTAKDPERARLMSEMRYAHYAVHAVTTHGHPFRATYDTWVRAKDYSEKDFTDVILGRWMDPAIKGYMAPGLRDFKAEPRKKDGSIDKDGILTIYHPLTPDAVGQGFSEASAVKLAETATDRLIAIFNAPGVPKQGKLSSKSVNYIITSRWPYSIHVAKPGHFTKIAKKMRQPLGRIYFANNNLGTPAFEEALFRGHCAANNVLNAWHKEQRKTFTQETWTRCPLD